MRIIKAACIICTTSLAGASSSQRKYDSSTLSYDPKVLGIRKPESRGLQCSPDSFAVVTEEGPWSYHVTTHSIRRRSCVFLIRLCREMKGWISVSRSYRAIKLGPLCCSVKASACRNWNHSSGITLPRRRMWMCITEGSSLELLWSPSLLLLFIMELQRVSSFSFLRGECFRWSTRWKRLGEAALQWSGCAAMVAWRL